MTSQAYERALAFLDDALAVLDESSITPTECARPSRPTSTPDGFSAQSRDREHDRRGDRQGFRPW
jgi:uncharacterized protein